jgi:hypothetical protein
MMQIYVVKGVEEMKIEFEVRMRGARKFYRFLGQVADYLDLYFQINGKEFFVSGMADCEPEYKIEGFFEDMKSQITTNEGKYVTFYCAEWYYHGTKGCRNPIEFLNWVEKNNFSFDNFSGIRHLRELTLEVWDFHGNLREASAAFSFRIWDERLVEKVRRKFNRLKKITKCR